MSVKKTGSPLSSGSESLEPLGGKDELERSAKVEKNFESTLAELTGQLEQAGAAGQTESPAQTAFKQIAATANLDTPEGAFSAVRESAGFLVSSRLKNELRDSKEGKKITSELSEYIAKDPFMHRKILGILQRLK